MTTELQHLIAAYAAIAIRPDHQEAELNSAARDLADHLMLHAAAFAERDRLEREVVAEFNSSSMAYAEKLEILGEWLVSNAASDDPAARS